MTAVLPAWKLELIEKKKKKQQNQRQQLETESARIASIPEWKRSLIEKKKELPEASEQATSCVNTIFGPRIVKRISQTSLSISNTTQEPGAKSDDESNKKAITRDTEFRSSYVLSTGTAERNSSVVKAVGFQSEVDHKPGNKHLFHRAIDNSRVYNQQVETTEAETAVSYEHVKSPSDLRRMFEKSQSEIVKPFRKLQWAKTAENNHVVGARTSEASFPLLDNLHSTSSQSQSLSKSVGDNDQSVRVDNSFNANAGLSGDPKLNHSSSPLVHRPYKSVVSTPPWLRNTLPRNVVFQVSKADSAQNEVEVPEGVAVVEGASVANVENGVKSASNGTEGSQIDVTSRKSDHLQTSECTAGANVIQGSHWQQTAAQSCLVVNESGPKEEETVTTQRKSDSTSMAEPCNMEKDVTLIDNDMEIVSGISATNCTECVEAESNDVHSNECLVEANVPERSQLHKKAASDKMDQEFVKLKRDSGHLEYVVTDRKNQEEWIPANETEVLVSPSSSPSGNAIGPISPDSSPDLVSQLPNVEENTSLPQGSVGSLRSKFGPSGAFHKKWSSEENLLLKGIHVTVDPVSRRQTCGRRPPPPTKRWSADVMNLMSRDLDEDDEVSSLSPQSDSKNTTLNRGRSSSLCDVCEEPGLDYFKHKSRVSQGIEHRMNRLIRKVSMSEINCKPDEAEESESLSDEDLPFNDAGGIPERSEVVAAAQAVANCEPVAIQGTSLTSAHETASEAQVVKEVLVRRQSISSDIEHRVSELLHQQVSQAEEGDNITNIDTNETKVKVKNESKELSFNSDMAINQDKQKNDFKTSHGFIHSTIDDTSDSDQTLPDSKPHKGSVHKLSTLFGVSIHRTSKKDKAISEVNSKDKTSLDVKTQKGTVAGKEDSKISKLFTRKTEKKSNHFDKQQTNVSIFPWLKKHDKEKDSSDNERTRNIHKTKDENSNFNIEGNDNLILAARNLRPVLKTGYVEQKLGGNLVLISQGITSQRRPPPRGVYPKSKLSILTSIEKDSTMLIEREKVPRELGKVDKNNSEKESGPQIPAVVTQNLNGDKETRGVFDKGTLIEEVPVTSIIDEVPVSAIDIPESTENDVTVSVIDVPASPDVHRTFRDDCTAENPLEMDDVNVSVIDMPSPSNEEKPCNFEAGHLKLNEISDRSDHDTTEESCGEKHSLVNGIGEDSSDGDEEEDEEEDENDDDEEEDENNDDEYEDDDEDEDEDEDEDVPISYIGAARHYPVPQVVFDSEPVQLKSCMSPKTAKRKVKAKVSFKPTHVVHDYPSEESVAILHDEMKTENAQLKTLQNYQPAGLVSMEEMIRQQNVIEPPVSNDDEEELAINIKNPELKYADDGEAFTDSTDHVSALLF